MTTDKAPATLAVDVLAVMEQAACSLRIDSRYEQAQGVEQARAAVAELIEMAAVVVAQAKEGREMDIIALADCIDLAGGKDARKAVRARVKVESA